MAWVCAHYDGVTVTVWVEEGRASGARKRGSRTADRAEAVEGRTCGPAVVRISDPKEEVWSQRGRGRSR